MPTFPASLPFPFVGTLDEAAAKNKITTSMDRGVKKMRRRTTANSKPISYKMRCTRAQRDLLMDFHDDDCFSGSVSFDYTHPATDEAVEARFVDEPASVHIEGDTYDVSIKLEILP